MGMDPRICRSAGQHVGHGRIEIRHAGAGLDRIGALALGIGGGIMDDAVERIGIAVLSGEAERHRAGCLGRGQ